MLSIGKYLLQFLAHFKSKYILKHTRQNNYVTRKAVVNKMIKLLLIVGLLLPWTSLLLAKKDTIRRFMPVTIFTSFMMTIIFQIAYTYEWWVIHEYIVPWGYMIDVTFAYGIYATGTFWIFRLTSHRFFLYAATNLIMDTFMCFVGLPLLGVLGIATYKNITPWEYLLVTYGLSLVIYVYHKWQQKIFISENGNINKYK